jgi:hypothetical protein
MGVKVTNNAFGTLSAGINTSDTTVTLDSGQGARFPTLGAGDYFYGTIVDTSNNLEIVKVTARSTDSMTVTRAQDNTTATAFSIGDRFELRPVAALFEDIGTDGISSSATSTAITIDSSNNVGIGEPSPDVNLHITDSSGAAVNLEGPTSGDIATGVHLYSGSTLESSWYVNPTHDTTFLSRSAFNIRTNNANRMSIDSSGRVTIPGQPCFHVEQSSGITGFTSGTVVPYDYVITNVGSHFNTSTHRFTAPIAGRYFFSVSLGFGNATSTNVWVAARFRKNGVVLQSNHYFLGHVSVVSNSNQYDSCAGSALLELAVNDYVDVTANYNTFNGDLSYGSLVGFLLS